MGGTARYLEELIVNIPGSILATGFVQDSELEDQKLNQLGVIRIKHLGRKISLKNDVLAWLELRKVIRNLKPDIVHTHTFKAGLIGRLIAGNHKRIHTFHGHLFDDNSFSTFQKWAIILMEQFLANRTDLLISVGEKVGQELRERKIGLKNRWLSIAPGVTPLPRVDKERARQELGMSGTLPIIGWMARMVEVKNPFLLLKVAEGLPHVNFLMAGGGDLLQEVQEAAPNNVKVLGWCDPSTFWSAVDVAISTSTNEGMPIALIEAQLAKLPVIATDVGATVEVIENGITGIIVKSNVNLIANAVNKLVSNKELRYAMGEKAEIRALQKFNVHQMIKIHISTYKKLSETRFK